MSGVANALVPCRSMLRDVIQFVRTSVALLRFIGRLAADVIRSLALGLSVARVVSLLSGFRSAGDEIAGTQCCPPSAP